MLHRVEDGVYCDVGPVRPIGLQITTTMTVLRLGDGTLLVHSPIAPTPERLLEVRALGQVAHLYAPNTFHHQWLAAWIEAFPQARVHAPCELLTKCPKLRIDRFHDASSQAELAGVSEISIRGFRLREAALIHHASGVAVVADLVSNIGRPSHSWTRFYSKVMGFHDRVALSRMLRWTSFDDRGAARQSVDAILAHEFETLIVGHGAPIRTNAREVLATATAWLPRMAPRLTTGTPRMSTLKTRPCG